MRRTARQIFLGLLGYPGDELVPEGGWLKRAAIGFWVILALVIAAAVVFL